jgi:integrase
MVHKMTYLQSRNGVYRVRKRVPQHLKEIIGRGEFLTQSVGTGNLVEANRLAIPILAEFTRIIGLAKRGEWPPLDPDLVPEWYFWHLTSREKPTVDKSVRDYLCSKSIVLSANSLTRLTREAQLYAAECAAHDDAVSDLLERIEQEGINPQSVTIPEATTPKIERFCDLIDNWARERKVTPKSKDEFISKTSKLTTFLGRDDVTRLTDKNIIDWKNHLLETGASHKTVENYLNVLKTLLNYAVSQKILSVSPAVGISFKAKDDGRDNRLPFTFDDAKLILTAARHNNDPVIRWANWISAFCGARLEEIVGCMREDIKEVNGQWCIDISLEKRDETATLKNISSKRLVPLHAAVIEEGLLEYVHSLPHGPLFPDLRADKYGKRSHWASKMIGPWLRAIIPDKRKVFHCWRHYFQDQCDLAGIEEKIQYAICGYQDQRVSRRYGSLRKLASPVRLEILAEAINKIRSPYE